MFPAKVLNVLMNWLKDNIDNPYPSEMERVKLCSQTGLNRKQLRSWFTDARRVRIFLPSPSPIIHYINNNVLEENPKNKREIRGF